MDNKALLQVGGQKVELRIVEGMQELGTYDHDSKIICINESLRDDDKEFFSTVRHELMHASLAISGVSFGMSEQVEEQVVRCFDGVFFPAYEAMINDALKWATKQPRKRSKAKADKPQRKRGKKG